MVIAIAVRMLREELQLLQEPGSYVGEVVKVMGKSKVLVKVSYGVRLHVLSLLSQDSFYDVSANVI